MKNLIKLKVILLLFYIVFTSHLLAADPIVPLPKPIVDEKTKTEVSKKKLLLPQKKPASIEKKVEIETTQDTEVISEEVKIGPFCYVGPNVELSENVDLVSNVHIEGDTKIGEGTKIFPFASIGTAPQDLKYKGEKTKLIIGKKIR